jgi:hypothetical protein
MISQELVHKLLDYDPETGILKWKAREEAILARRTAAKKLFGEFSDHD